MMKKNFFYCYLHYNLVNQCENHHKYMLNLLYNQTYLQCIPWNQQFNYLVSYANSLQLFVFSKAILQLGKKHLNINIKLFNHCIIDDAFNEECNTSTMFCNSISMIEIISIQLKYISFWFI